MNKPGRAVNTDIKGDRSLWSDWDGVDYVVHACVEDPVINVMTEAIAPLDESLQGWAWTSR